MIWQATKEEKASVALNYVIKMMKELGLEIVAEGVETEEQAAFLKKCGCDVAQGFYYAKPMCVDEFEKQILCNSKYNMANKFVAALSKLYIFDDNIYFLNDDFEDGVSFLEYYKDINRFIDDIMYNLTILNEGMYFVFNDLKIGLEISYWKVKIINFGCKDLKFIMDIFKSEGLFISNEYI